MTEETRKLRELFAQGDALRDAGLTPPGDVARVTHLLYGEDPKWNALDVYYPRGTEQPLPTIVHIHGGGYVYGDKEVYQFYGMAMAQRGFTFVNFNYHLAPEHQFPTPLLETNQVMEWVCRNAATYYIDTNNIFVVGDSAGAQLASQYALMWANPAYSALFGVTVPQFRLAAVGLNCGMYNPAAGAATGGIMADYFGAHPEEHAEKLKVLERIDAKYPPAYVMSATMDFLRDQCEPMAQLLTERGVTVACKIYGQEGDQTAGHVFHVNCRLPLAKQCNDDEAAFFKQFVRAGKA